MPRLKKIFFTVLAVLCTAALSGCSIAGAADTLLAPPKLSEEQSAVYAALEAAAGKDLRLRYPRYGEYRSAFVFNDIDGDGSDEAIVFYEKSGKTDDGGSLRINIMDKRDGKWRSLYDHAGEGASVDRIMFAGIGSSSVKSIIIGYTRLSGEKSVSVHSFAGGRLFTDFTDSYSTMFIMDMDRDGTSDLVLIRPGSQLRKASMSLVSRDPESGSVSERCSIALDNAASDFVNVISGYVGAETPAVFIDGLSDGRLTTEIIYSVNGDLRNPLYLGETALIENTRRRAGYLSTDIDLDNIIEIPTLSPFPGYADDSRNSLYSADWNVFDNYSITKKYSSFYNVSEGYCFILPGRWDGVVTVKKDAATGEIVFYKFRIDLENSTSELMRIAVANDTERQTLLADGYTLLKSNNHINYLVKCPDDGDEPLVLTNTEISNNFYIIV